jgi:hypothetical protein
LGLAGCKNDDNAIFDKGSTARVRALMDECAAAVTEPEYGWKMLYLPDPQYGGFNLVMKFTETDGLRSVEMKGDFVAFRKTADPNGTIIDNPGSTASTSTYSFNASQGPVLSFDTQSILHHLADPEVAPVATGLKGEFEFVIDRVTPDSLIFRGKKYGKDIVMVRARQEDWEIMDTYRANVENLAPQDNSPFFRGLTMNQTAVNFSYIPGTRTVNYIYADEMDKKVYTGTAGVYASKDGVKFTPKIRVNGVVLEELKYNASANSYEANSPGVVGRLEYSDTPPFPFYNSIATLQLGSNVAGLPKMADIDLSTGQLGGALVSMLSLLGITNYMSADLSANYAAMVFAGMKQFRLTWNLDNMDGQMVGPAQGGAWMGFFGGLGLFEESLYTLDYRMNVTVLRSEGDQLRFDFVTPEPLPAGYDDRLRNNVRVWPTDDLRIGNTLTFVSNMEEQVGLSAFRTFFGDPGGFTVVPESDKVFTFVNLGDSRKWIRLTKE